MKLEFEDDSLAADLIRKMVDEFEIQPEWAVAFALLNQVHADELLSDIDYLLMENADIDVAYNKIRLRHANGCKIWSE